MVAYLQAKLTDTVTENVVYTQHGWWQACPELHLLGYDPFSEKGANVNRLYTDAVRDPVAARCTCVAFRAGCKKSLDDMMWESGVRPGRVLSPPAIIYLRVCGRVGTESIQ